MTIVAAWISEETGVGPSIASGSQVWSGSCADLAKAPTRSSRQIAVTVHSLVLEDLRRLGEDLAVFEGAEFAEDQEGGEDEADVADDVDHEGLHPRPGRRRRAGTRS